ncbi:adenosine receptor A3-like [Nematostella vectensis]|uniref:adenosine receptor A3-like n=1 Tax=Nematostella vectensis TaxID=45351 RepID=UPI002076FC84|nr:adenosine receptor A3-like [Nematostella vectensis]
MSNQSDSRYVWAPIPLQIRWTCATFLLLMAVGSCCGNGLVLYLVKTPVAVNRRALQRTLTAFFIRNLALSSLATSLVSTPLLVAELLRDFLNSDWACRFYSFFVTSPISTTITNLIVIGVERYLTIYRPNKVPYRKTCKRLVKVAWLAGVIVAMTYPGSSATLQKFQVDEYHHTFICRSDNENLKTKVLGIAISVIQYIIPAVSLTVMSVRVLKFLHCRRQQAHPLQANSTFSASMGFTLWQLKNSYMFASLILAFVIPYGVPVLYTLARAIISARDSYEEIYLRRIIFLSMCCANTVINPIIYLYCIREMRRRTKEILSRCCGCFYNIANDHITGIELDILPRRQNLEPRSPCVLRFSYPEIDRKTEDRVTARARPLVETDAISIHMVGE